MEPWTGVRTHAAAVMFGETVQLMSVSDYLINGAGYEWRGQRGGAGDARLIYNGLISLIRGLIRQQKTRHLHSPPDAFGWPAPCSVSESG
jgi:hypothetical protein